MRFKHLRALGLAVFGAIAVTLVCGCSSDPSKLTRDRAATLITKDLGDVAPLIRVTTGTIPMAGLPNEDRGLIGVGLATWTVKTGQLGTQQATIILTRHARDLAANQKWRQETLAFGITAWQIPVGTYQFGSVTGIQFADKAHAMVTFTYTSVPNEVGKLFLDSGHANAFQVISPLADIARAYPETQAQQAQNNAMALVQALGVNTNPAMDVVFGKPASSTMPFTLYDDGWRLGQ